MSTRSWTAAFGIAAVIGAVPLGVLLPKLWEEEFAPLWSWLGMMGMIGIGLALFGYAARGVWYGVFVDERNHISLSRSQMLVWTVLVLAAWGAASLANAEADITGQLIPDIPGELLVLVGISTGSLVGSSMVKAAKTSSPGVDARSPELMTNTELSGRLVVNREPSQARLSDIVSNEEASEYRTVDLGKVQMLYFTALAVLIYAFLMGKLFASGVGDEGFSALPAVDESLVTLFAISQGTYIANKVRPRGDRSGAADSAATRSDLAPPPPEGAFEESVPGPLDP